MKKVKLGFSAMLSKPKFRDASKSGVLLLRRWRRRECRLQTQGVVAKSSYQCCHQPVLNDGEEDTEWVRHKERLLHISQRLSQQNLQDLLFLVHDIIMPTVCHSTIYSCTKLFQELQQKGHVGVNNYSKLKRWLVEIGRMDLARELPGTQIKEDQQSTVVKSKDQSHRFLMLQVSESLRKAEVKRLVYLCSAIPQSLHKTITEGFHLFQELEQRGLISPGNYDYIAECLRCIGREDLAWELILHQHNMPSSLHSFRQAEQMLSFFCQQKRQTHQSLLAELETNTTPKTWMKNLSKILPRLVATWNRQATSKMMEAVHRTCGSRSTTIDEVICSTLKVMFKFFTSEAESMAAIINGDSMKLRSCSEKCHSLYQEFDESLERIGWNPSTRRKVARLYADRMMPHSKAVDGVSKSIQSFCKEFLGKKNLQAEFEDVNFNIYNIESSYYLNWHKMAMMEWISDLISLGQTSAIDLHRHMATLTQLLSQYQHIITQAMPTISDIVGKEIADITTPLLSNILPEDPAKKTPLQTESGDNILITFYNKRWISHLLELIAVASGHRVNHKQVGEAYTRHMFRNSSAMITSGNKFGDSFKDLLYAQLAECKKSAVRAASRGPQGCSDVIRELF